MSTTFKCFTCGAELKWSPKSQNWKCEFCDSEFDESAFKDFIEENNAQNNETQKQEETKAYNCSYCGAEVITEKDDAALFCVFCQRPVVLESQLSGEFKPQHIIPFKFDKKDAEAALKNYILKRRFLPDSFRKNIEKVTGVYLPFWIYDVQTDFDVQGTADIVTRWSDSDYEYTKTDTFSFVRKGEITFDGIPVDASTSADDKLMDSIEPFDYTQIKPFAMPYLSGFLAQKFNVSQEESFVRAKERVVKSTNSKIDSTMSNYTRVRKLTDEMNVSKNCKYALLPVWLLTALHKEKPYYFAMNGQSGKFVGNLPIDAKKVFKFSAITFLLSSIGASLLCFTAFMIK
jgi:DNA-directed RNA polymerase subunit RPC12/RpoP